MRNALLTLFVLLITLSLVACAPDAPSPAVTAEAPDAADAAGTAPDSSAPVAGSRFTEEDMAVVYENTAYPLLRDAQPLLKALGEPSAYMEAQSCVYEGMDKSFEYGDISVYTNPDGSGDIAYEVIVTGGAYQTVRGVTVGAPLADVEAAYGAGQRDGRYLGYFVTDEGDMRSPRIYFEMSEDDTVASIDIYYPTNITDD